MPSYSVALCSSGSHTHISDLEMLREKGLAIPHDYSSWPLHCHTGSFVWCRVTDVTGKLATGFSVCLYSSRAVPWARIGTIDRVGRELHEPVASNLGDILTAVARKLPRLLRLDARVFDEVTARREQVGESLRRAGWTKSPTFRNYSHTLIMELGHDESAVLSRLSTRVRSSIRKALESPDLLYRAVDDPCYLPRIVELFCQPFARTGGKPPTIDAEGILEDSRGGSSSLLIGAFDRHRVPPQDLIALAWAPLHGDYAVLEINASERSELFHKLSPGFGLVSEIIRWAIDRGARWIDLGGVSAVNPGANDPMRGIVEFKSRFSADFREVAQEWHFEPSLTLALAAKAARKVARAVSGNRRPNA